ncbi:MAG: alanyl-tRNA editing protein [Promethearchaeota archaeon]
MTKTELIYLEDSYLKEAEVTVLEANAARNSVTLDGTIFYPEGGGQPSDKGRIDSALGSSTVIHVAKQGNQVYHYLEGPLPSKEEEVTLKLDWDRRYAHMRNHTAQHLLSRIIFDKYRARTAGNQVHADASHIDFAPATFQSDELPVIEAEANRLIQEDHLVTIAFIDRAELEKEMGPDRADLSRLPTSIKRLRMVRIGNFDAYPCAGTHVRSTGELKQLTITKRKSKGKERIRITYQLASL